MARNGIEQVNYLIKRRKSGMSNADFKNELFYLYELGLKDGINFEKGYQIFKNKKNTNEKRCY